MTEKHGMQWFEDHLYHLNSPGEFSDLYQKDVLNYERQLRSWSQGSDRQVFIVQYEDLWDRVDDLSAFLNIPVSLPERRPRAPKSLPESINIELFDHLRGKMAKFDEEISRR